MEFKDSVKWSRCGFDVLDRLNSVSLDNKNIKFLVFGYQKKISREIKLKICNISVVQVFETTSLGVMIDHIYM